MRILHVAPSYYPAHVYGGPIRSVYELCRHLAANRCEVKVLTTDANGDTTLPLENGRELNADDVSIRYCRRWAGDSISSDLLFRLRISVAWADVVHLTAVYSFPTMPTLLACCLEKKPLIWSPRGALQRWPGSRRLAFKRAWEIGCSRILPYVTVLHTTSPEESRESLERFPGVTAFEIPNGIDVSPRVDRRRGDCLNLLFVGRLDPKKGIENLIDAGALLTAESSFQWKLTIAGAGDSAYTLSLANRVSRLGLSHAIHIAGMLTGEAKTRAFRDADIVIVPSFTENFGVVVAEALSHGAPVIASKGTPWARLEEKGCGLWVENDPQSLSTAILRMRNAPLLEMGQCGREWMREEFGWDSIAKRMISLYQSAANIGAGATARALPALDCLDGE